MSSPLNYHLTRISSNRKFGPIPASTTSAASCWDGCAYFRTCYAKWGHLSWHWDKVNDGRRGSDFSQFLREVRALPRGQLWRYGQAGELPGIGARINAGQLARLAKANKGRQGFAYTHKPLTPANLKAIRAANAAGFTVNLSANGLKHADKLAKLGLPVVCVIPRDSPTLQKTASGVPVLACPHEREVDPLQCSRCGICQLRDRKFIVGFKSIGASPSKVDEIARNN